MTRGDGCRKSGWDSRALDRRRARLAIPGTSSGRLMNADVEGRATGGRVTEGCRVCKPRQRRPTEVPARRLDGRIRSLLRWI